MLQAGDIVDDIRAGLHGGGGHAGFHGINGNRYPGLLPQTSNDGKNPPQFFLRFHRGGSRTRALPADIQNVRAFLYHNEPPRDGG